MDEPRSVLQVIEEPFVQGGNAEYEDADSDDDYDGILKPAFAVDGDPDFESGEPLDGFEYLRRVRYALIIWLVSSTRALNILLRFDRSA